MPRGYRGSRCLFERVALGEVADVYLSVVEWLSCVGHHEREHGVDTARAYPTHGGYPRLCGGGVVTARQFADDPCMCQGPNERRLVNGLSLLVCRTCGKASTPRGVRRGDAQDAITTLRSVS